MNLHHAQWVNVLHVGKWMNSPTLYWQNIFLQLWKLYGQQNGHCATLPGSMTSYCKLTYIQKSQTLNLLWQTDHCTPLGMSLLNAKVRWPFPRLLKNCQNGLGLNTAVYSKLCNYVWEHIDDPRKSSLAFLYPLCHLCAKLFQAFPLFYSDGKLGGAWEKRLNFSENDCNSFCSS